MPAPGLHRSTDTMLLSIHSVSAQIQIPVLTLFSEEYPVHESVFLFLLSDHPSVFPDDLSLPVSLFPH